MTESTKEILRRVGITFIEAAAGILIPQIVSWLSNPGTFSWKELALPALTGSIGAGISAAYNVYKETKK